MRIDEHSAAVDADFIDHVADMNFPIKQTARVFSTVMKSFGCEAVIHPLVYENEIRITKQKQLIDEVNIKRPTFDDILCDEDDRREYYCAIFPELLNKLNGTVVEPESVDIFTYWKAGSSFGETHTVTMCLLCGCGVFLSDDGDAKELQRIVKNAALGSINVYSRKECIDELRRKGELTLDRSEHRAFTHIIK